VNVRIEHVNITVGDADRSAALIERLFGWKIRWAGPSMNNGRTVHIGTDSQYLALYSRPDADGRPLGWSKGMPLNHVAVEVDDLDAMEAKVVEAGLEPFAHGDYEPGRRFYFFDPDGIEFEVVSYAPALEKAA
jgi:catechol 2,3-dioxygenase-like lactoylglutathione lyase family enzyme